MYLDRTRRRIERRGFPDPEEIHACTPDEVEALENRLGHPLPGAVREFLLWCGRGLGELWSGNRCYEYDELLVQSGLQAAREILTANGQDPAVLDDRVLLFQFDECDQFTFVRLDEGEDPPVYGRDEGQPIERKLDHFSDFVALIVDQEFGMTEAEEEQAEGPIRGPDQEGASEAVPLGTEAGTPALVGILPPEVAADPGRAEVSFGFLSPSVQRQLGELRASFKPSAANTFAAIVIGVGLLGFGLLVMGYGIREAALLHFQMPLTAWEGMSWFIFAVMESVSGGMALIGVILIRRALQLTKTGVFVGEAGLCRRQDRRTDVLLWAEVGVIVEIASKDRFPLKLGLEFLIPAGISHHYFLRSKDGRELAFDASSVKHLARFRAVLERAASLHRIPWSVLNSPL